MCDAPASPGYGRLAVVEERDAFVVVREDDPEDWLARFEKSSGFPAQAWAENMVRVYNYRLAEEHDAVVVEATTGDGHAHLERPADRCASRYDVLQ